MNLGYLASAIPGPGGTADRASYARAVGFSEVLTELPHAPRGPALSGAMAVHRLDTLPGREARPALQLVGEAPAPCPRIVAAGADPAAVRALSRAGYQPLSDCLLDPEAVAAHWPAHVTGCTHGSIRACPRQWRVARILLVATNPARAETAVRDPGDACRAYLGQRLGRDPGSEEVAELADRVVLRGTPETVAGGLIDFRTACGPFGALVLVDLGWHDRTLARDSLLLLSQVVAPLVDAETRSADRWLELA
ncbi:hypothetical protein PVT71_23170 (plasmid) [Salipiger sp. H15]|uniref:Luciferase-like domain-containing protein n=1 Tax=Alloyangia sp. H15 TaxID=3029062 RepID=A0AAU8APQ8_9RHOB